MPDVIPDPGEFADCILSMDKNRLIRKDIVGTIVTDDSLLIACWSAAAWSAKARALPPESKNQAEWQTYDDNAALCLRLAAKGEIK